MFHSRCEKKAPVFLMKSGKNINVGGRYRIEIQSLLRKIVNFFTIMLHLSLSFSIFDTIFTTYT